MKQILIIFFLSFSISAIGQRDTKARLVDFKSSECVPVMNVEIISRIINCNLSKDTLAVSISAEANCIGIYEPRIEYSNDTLKLYYTDRKIESVSNGIVTFSELDCDCFFNFEYFISGIDTEPSTILLNDKIVHKEKNAFKTYPESFELFNNDTINHTDIFGRKQGVWFNQDIESIFRGFWKDEELVMIQSIDYYPNKYVKRVVLRNSLDSINNHISVKFLENGQLNEIIISNNFKETILHFDQ